MSHLPTIITDLAMILLVAGVTTIVFKKLNQPLVLGYIIAGFITGPNFSFFPTITDSTNVSAWSEIGVIFLMFALGLEFSFYKLKKVGGTAFIAFAVILCGMMGMGYVAGSLLGWTTSEKLLLGGMLSMSSTAIIIKAFDDLKLSGRPFTEVVFGVLIIEDIVGIIMLVLVSTLAAATSAINPTEILFSVARLAFFIILWFVCGMFLIPTFFRRAQDLMNDETLVVVSIGLCLGMVVLANSLGFSSALGAFIMGSLIAEAPNAEKIEHLIAPIKNLFSAVFFVSVGMMVNPVLLLEQWLPVLVIVVTVIIGQIIFSSLGILASGKSLKTAILSGFALTQIGEFSFIVANLGTSVGMLREFIYPIIVAVSVITTFTTPFCINAAESVYNKLILLLPDKYYDKLVRYGNVDNNDSAKDNDWKNLLTAYGTRMLVYAVLFFAICIGAYSYILPYLDSLVSETKLPQLWTIPGLAYTITIPYARIVTAAGTLLVLSPFLRALLFNKTDHDDLVTTLWFKKTYNRVPLIILSFGNLLLAALTIQFIFSTILGLHGLISFVAVLFACYLISKSQKLMSHYLSIESRFLINLNEKHMKKHRDNDADCQQKDTWFDEDIHVAQYQLVEGSPYIGKKLMETDFRSAYGFNVLQIISKKDVIDLPGGSVTLHVGDKLMIIGSQAQVNNFTIAIDERKLGMTCLHNPRTLKQFTIDGDHVVEEHKFQPFSIDISEHAPFLLSQSLQSANLRNRWNCMVVGIERGAFNITNPHVSLRFEKGDLLWVLGTPTMFEALAEDGIMEKVSEGE